MNIRLVLPLIALLSACGGPEFIVNGREMPTPDEPGLYVVRPDLELQKLDGDAKWEQRTWAWRSNLGPASDFVVYDDSLAGSDASAVRLSRVAWLRSELQADGQAAPVKGSTWVVTGLEDFRIPLAVTRHPANPAIVHLRPRAQILTPGLYELAIAGSLRRKARIGIEWGGQDERSYAAANCVDRVVGEPSRFLPCAATTGVAAGPVGSRGGERLETTPEPMRTADIGPADTRLKIELEKPVVEDGQLAIRGRVTNRTGAPQSIPPLEGTIVDASGNAVDTWRFRLQGNAHIPPNGVSSFITMRPLVKGASRVDVAFVQ